MTKKRRKGKGKRSRQKIVIKVAGPRPAPDPILPLLAQVVVGGLVYGSLAYVAANRPRPSVAGFVARHPSASFELAAMKANEVSTDLITKGKRQWRKAQRWLTREAPEPVLPDPEVERQLTYKPGSVGRG